MSRRAFLGFLTSAIGVTMVVNIIGCTTEPATETVGNPTTGNGCPQPALAKPAADRPASTISSNHGHAATVTTAQQDAGTAFNLSIQGTSGHDHTLALTTQDLADLKAGAQLVKTSSNSSGHTHTVTFAAVVTSIARPC
jgi:hypothetical protein